MPHPRIFGSSTLAVACLILASPSSTTAQSTCDWERVRALRPGQAITINTAPGQSVSGRLVTTSATDLTIAAGGVSQTIARDRVVEVSAAKTRTWKAAAGVVVAGLGLMVVNATNRPAEAGPGPAWFAGAPMAAIGALIVHSEKPRHGLIYRRP